jgi:hypothetical protein
MILECHPRACPEDPFISAHSSRWILGIKPRMTGFLNLRCGEEMKREPTRTAALLGRVYVRQRGRSTSYPALALAERMAGTNAGGRGAGTSAARFRMLPLARHPRIRRGSGTALALCEPDDFFIGRQMDPHASLRECIPMQHQEFKPAQRCWEILTVAPQRRCRDCHMRVESWPRHDETWLKRRLMRFCVREIGRKNRRRYWSSEYFK